MMRLTMIHVEAMRSANPNLDGVVVQVDSTLAWLRTAARAGFLSQDRQGFFLTDEQEIYWRGKGALLP